MLIIASDGESFEPTRCLECPLNNTCNMAPVAAAVGGTVVAEGFAIETEVSELVSDIVKHGETGGHSEESLAERAAVLTGDLKGLIGSRLMLLEEFTKSLRYGVEFIHEEIGEPGELDGIFQDINPDAAEDTPVDSADSITTRIVNLTTGKAADYLWFDFLTRLGYGDEFELLEFTELEVGEVLLGILSLENPEFAKYCRAVDLYDPALDATD